MRREDTTKRLGDSTEIDWASPTFLIQMQVQSQTLSQMPQAQGQRHCQMPQV